MGSLLQHCNQPSERNHYRNDRSLGHSNRDFCRMPKKMSELQAKPKFASAQFRILPNVCLFLD